MPQPGKILVIRGGAIGDFILTFPVFAALRRQFRHCRLEILGYPRIAQLAVAGGLADEVHSVESAALASFFVPSGTLPAETAQYFAKFDLVVSYIYDLDRTFQTNVARCSKARFVAGPHRPDETRNVHATSALLRPLEVLGIANPDPQPRIAIRQSDRSAIQNPALLSEHVRIQPGSNSTVLALHPGSGSERKNWPESHWTSLLQTLSKTTALLFLIIGGEAEAERCLRLAALIPSERVRLAQGMPLVALAEQLALCKAFIGHDSGISHLAAALGLPGLVLWGETNEQIWRPLTSRMRLLHGPAGLPSLAVATVIERLSSIIPHLSGTIKSETAQIRPRGE